MNFLDLQEKCWDFLGYTDTGRRRNWRLQQIKDALNHALFRIAKTAPSLWVLTQESSISVVGGTATYNLSDYCWRPLSVWTQDAQAHLVKMRWPRTADRDGSRNPSLAYSASGGPWEFVWQPRLPSYKSGASGAATGASATIGASVITLNASATPLVAADVGRMIRLNNEDVDYQIVTIGAGGLVPTVDRAIQGRIQVAQKELTDGVAPAYTNVRWDLGNPQAWSLKILPPPPSGLPAQTVYYRYQQIPRQLAEPDDLPPIESEYHDLIWKGALKMICLQLEDQTMWQAYTTEFEQRLEELGSQETENDDSDEPPWYETLNDTSGDTARQPIDVYRRY